MTNAVQYRLITIGTLAAHPLWQERVEVRTGHTTTTLIETRDARIIVDPGLPAAALAARMSERTPIKPAEVTHVFLSNFQPDHRRGLGLFEHAQWLIHGPERAGAELACGQQGEAARDGGDHELAAFLEAQLELLSRCNEAPDEIELGVDLFPLPGVTAGNCGLLLPQPSRTILIAGDAVATGEHLEQGKVLPTCADVASAQESFREAIEIADVIVPGRDDQVLNPVRARLG